MEPRIVVLLSFVSITVLTAIAVLAAAVGWLPEAKDEFISWGMPIVLGEIVASVVVFSRQDWGNRFKINIKFENFDPEEIPLVSCEYIAKNLQGKVIKRGRLEPILGIGGWQVELPPISHSNYRIRMSCKDRNGYVWEIHPFLPNVITHKAVKF